MESSLDNATFREITSQTPAWQEALEVTCRASLPQPGDYEQALFTGCGSTFYLSLSAAALFQQLTGCSARAVPAGELLLNPRTVLTGRKTLLVAVSRSGTTTETVRAVEEFRLEERGRVVVISNNEGLLAGMGDSQLIIPGGREESVAQTRSFASMYVAATAFAARSAGRDDLLKSMAGLPEEGERLIAEYEALARRLGTDLEVDRFYFLGSGPQYGLACEASLKMKEMTLTHSEPFHFFEFRHGPKAMVTGSTVVVGLVSESNASREVCVLNEMQALGGRTVQLAQSGAEVALQSQVPECVRGVLYLPFLQLMAFHRSLGKGLNPDRPKNLTAVVRLNL